VDWLYTFGTLVLGLLIRLAIPIALTALLVWSLRRLDERWQAEAGLTPAARAPIGNPGCWKINDCPPESRAKCKAYAHPELPCWQIHRERDGRLLERCLICKVFREAVAPFPA
jgi:hypothetical protein